MATGDGAEVGLAVVREAGDPGGWADSTNRPVVVETWLQSDGKNSRH
jgi:hypothetical protein